MPTTNVYKDVKIYIDGFDISGQSNSLKLDYGFDEVEVTPFGSECHYSLPGLAKLAFDLEGLAASDGLEGSEDVLSARLGGSAAVFSLCPLTGAAGEAAYFTKGIDYKYEAGAAVGEAYKFSAGGSGVNTPLVRGLILATGQKTTSGSGIAYNLGAVAEGKKLYAALHVLSVDGSSPTLDVAIESDDAQGFASPITRATFPQMTARGAQYLAPVSGPITDTWWRVTWTIGGSGEDLGIQFVAIVGIQ